MDKPSYNKLRGRIVELYGTQENFRKALGISSTALSNKMRGETGFSQKDIIKWCALLNIDLHDVGSYFYA
ncbi:MAG: DUF739 family protein [Lachnospiraceae bacterium]|nr:DUF739 family protein [Lachnospiraceae bacterium]